MELYIICIENKASVSVILTDKVTDTKMMFMVEHLYLVTSKRKRQLN